MSCSRDFDFQWSLVGKFMIHRGLIMLPVSKTNIRPNLTSRFSQARR